jgi:hypothetical protein
MNDETLTFFYQEMQEQSNHEDYVIDWDDYAQGSVELESYDP